MPADQHSVHRRQSRDSETRANPASCRPQVIPAVLRAFRRAIPCFPQGAIHMPLIESRVGPGCVPQAAMWTEIAALSRRPLARAPKAVAFSRPVHRTSRRYTDARHRLFPSASRFRRDRRNPDHGRARGGGAIRQCLAGRASLPDGALEEAARPCAGRDRRGAGPGALHAAGRRPDPVAGGEVPRARRCPACRCWGRSCGCSSPISAPRPSTASAPSTCSTPNISSASTRSTSP